MGNLRWADSSPTDRTHEENVRPILRYHGGKWLLAKWIISHMPEHRIYCEPFGGAASVLLRKRRSYAEVYNDLDAEVVNLFHIARDRGPDLAAAIELTPYSRDEYYAAFEVSPDPLESARRLVIRSFMGFGSNAIRRDVKSGFRSKSHRSGTTPSHDWRNYPEALYITIERLQGVVIENKPAEEVMLANDAPTTLHYCDPPYVYATRGVPGKGYNHEMTDDEHVQLRTFLGSLTGMVMVSGYRCDLYDQLYADWRRVDKAALADGARKRTESIWFSENINGEALLC